MASYFDEMDFEELRDGETPNHFLHLARLLRDFNMFQELGVEHKLAPPASPEAVKNLPEVTVEDKGIKCPICLKEHEVGETLKKMPCEHKFHQNCILPWLAKVYIYNLFYSKHSLNLSTSGTHNLRYY